MLMLPSLLDDDEVIIHTKPDNTESTLGSPPRVEPIGAGYTNVLNRVRFVRGPRTFTGIHLSDDTHAVFTPPGGVGLECVGFAYEGGGGGGGGSARE
ncbi:major facilitator superfamily domain-containing protein 4 [Anopheles sinensis]|uniref:Major facilitator superfamily domain-containing protein 4 n=1 Tax=Anopheles sinensis TaxID=74873 RepID=A0A084WFU6_ANOSI|nr:major facilitator superfamily domain-containing protein 4 [Anopheles sinensis]